MPLCLPSDALAEVTPLLLELGGAALGWAKVRRSDQSTARSASRLHQAYRYQVLEAAIREREIITDLQRLRSVGVEPLSAKGWAVARLYAEKGLRPYGDVDLCVRPEQYAIARSALWGPKGPASPVDLHRGLSRGREGQAFALLDDRSLDELYQRSEIVGLGEIETRILGPEDHLRLLCLHALTHGVYRPLWLCDVGAALEARPHGFDWDWFLYGDRRRTDWAICTLRLTHHLLGARLEDTPIVEQAQRLPRWLAPAVLWQWGMVPRPRRPLASFLGRPAGILKEIRHHWPNGIEATVGVGGPLNEWPRLPFQLGATALRTAQFLRDLPRLRRELRAASTWLPTEEGPVV